MSELPNIDAAVTQELNSQLSEKNYQVVQFKALAEALLKERDESREALAEIAKENQALKAEIDNSKSEPVPTITDL